MRRKYDASLNVYPEAGDLREVRSSGNVQDVHVVVHIAPIESAEDEEPAVSEERGVVAAPDGRFPGNLTRLVL